MTGKQFLTAAICISLYCVGVSRVSADSVNYGKLITDSLMFTKSNAFTAQMDEPFPIKIFNFIPPATMQIKPFDNNLSLMRAVLPMKVARNKDMLLDILINENGRYVWINNFDWVGKLEFSNKNEPDFTKMIMSRVKVYPFWYNVFMKAKGVEYSCEDTVYDGQECFKITAKIPLNEHSIGIIGDISPEKIASAGVDQFADALPTTLTFIIGKNPQFCYSMDFYTAKGRYAGTVRWRNVIIKDIPEEVFYPNDKLSIITLASNQELDNKVLGSAIAPDMEVQETPRKLMPFIFISLGVTGALLLGLVIVRKFRKR